MNNKIDEIDKIGEFTQDLRILPNPEIFEKIKREQQKAHADKIKDEIVKAVSKSVNGNVSVSINSLEIMPQGISDPVYLDVKKWANSFKYDIRPGSFYGNGAIGEIQISPISINKSIKSWVSNQIRNISHISFVRIFLWALIFHFIIRTIFSLIKF